MGHDIYLRWEGMTEKDKSNQITGFDVTCGHLGYLRASYGSELRCEAIHLLLGNLINVDGEKSEQGDSILILNITEKLIKKNLEIIKTKLFDKEGWYIDTKKGLDERNSYIEFVNLIDKLKAKEIQVWIDWS